MTKLLGLNTFRSALNDIWSRWFLSELIYKNNCKNCGQFSGAKTNFKLNKRIFECKECFLFFRTIRELCQFCYSRKYAWKKDGQQACTKCVCAGALRNTLEDEGKTC